MAVYVLNPRQPLLAFPINNKHIKNLPFGFIFHKVSARPATSGLLKEKKLDDDSFGVVAVVFRNRALGIRLLVSWHIYRKCQ